MNNNQVKKSEAVAIILPVFFWQFGMLYSTVSGFWKMLLLQLSAVILSFWLLPVGEAVAANMMISWFVIWPTCIIWSILATKEYNKTGGELNKNTEIIIRVIAMLLACAIILLTRTSNKTETETKETIPFATVSQPISQPTQQNEPGYYYDGMYKVGVDIPDGEYILFAKTDSRGYFQISKDSNDNLDSIVSNDNFVNTSYVTVHSGEFLTIKRARAKLASDVPAQTNFCNGMYKIGKDLQAGEYKIESMNDTTGYVEVSRDSRGNNTSIINNDNFSGRRYIFIKNGQYLKLSRVCIVTTA